MRVRDRGIGWLPVLLFVGSFFGPFGGSMILPMFGVLKDWFNVDVFLVGLSITSFMLPFSFAQLFSGLLSDVFYGRRRVVASGFMVYGLGALAAGFSPNIWLFLASRAVQGLGAALVIPVLMAMVGDTFSKEKRGKVMGMMAAATTLGTTAGPLIGGYLATVDWRLGFLAAFLLASSMASASLMVLSADGLSRGRVGDALRVFLEVAGKRRVMAVGLLGFTLFYARISLYTYLSDTLVSQPYQVGEEVVGSLLALAGVGGLVGGFSAGYLTDRVGREAAAALGFSSASITMLLYLFPSWFDLLPLLLFFTGFTVTHAFTSVNTMAVEAEAKYRATATSIYGFTRFLGYAAAPIISYPIYLSGSIQLVASASFVSMLIALIILATVWRKT